MKNEIERKFLVKKMPSLKWLEAICYERCFLIRNEKIEIRVQKKAEKYEFERKEKSSNLFAKKQKIEIQKKEFERFKKTTKEEIIRDSYILDNKDPEISVKVYHGRFEGLVRVEVEFSDEKSAKKFTPPKWFWKEITDSPLGKDSKLLDLSDKEFKKLMK